MPDCACHGEPQIWHKDDRILAGGYWRCNVQHRANRRAYNRSAKGLAAYARYSDSPHGRLNRLLNGMTRIRIPY